MNCTTVKLPESFKELNLNILTEIVGNFVYLNKRNIPTIQRKNWYDKSLVPMLFMEFVKEHGFVFKENSYAIKTKTPAVGLLSSLRKKGEVELKESTNTVKHVGRTSKSETVISKIQPPTIYKCTNDECIHNNSGKCSSHPMRPNMKNEQVVDCLRYTSKNFKFKNKSEALIVYSDLND